MNGDEFEGKEAALEISEHSALRDAISDLLARHGGRRGDPSQSRLAQLVARLPGTDDGQPKPGKDYDAVAALLIDELRDRVRLSRRRARDGAWCLWETSPAIAHDETLLDRYLEQLAKLADKRSCRALCGAYLVQFREDRPGLTRVSAALNGLCTHAGEPYARLQREMALFSLPDGPQRLGQEAVRQRRSPVSVLEAAGLASAHLVQGGFVEPCARAALRQLAAENGLGARERLELVRTLAVDAKSGRLFFPQHKFEFANALLLPYRVSDPPDDVKAETLNLVIGAIADPRSRAAEWRSMEEAAQIARRWLTKASINQFLDVVDAVALDRMWRWRRKFWNAVLDTKGASGHSIVEEAWVVFDEVGHAEARRMDIRNLSVGRFVQGGGLQRGHSVLLLRIGRMVIAEWSHNGSVRIWYDAIKPGAPQLYKTIYSADELRHGTGGYPCDWDRPHSSPDTYAWQNALAEKLYELTRIRIPSHKYM